MCLFLNTCMMNDVCVCVCIRVTPCRGSGVLGPVQARGGSGLTTLPHAACHFFGGGGWEKGCTAQDLKGGNQEPLYEAFIDPLW